MSEKITNLFKNNFGLKMGSIACALILWLVVINLTDPVQEKIVARIPVEVLHEDAITNTGRVFDITGDAVVNVLCSAKKTDLNAIRSHDFRAYVDMRYSYGMEEDQKAVKINLEIASTSENKDKILDYRIDSSDVLYFTTENIVTKRYDIQVVTTGEVAQGFELDGSTLVAYPQVLEVTGPESAFANVSRAAVTVDISGFNGEVNELPGTVVLQDGNGKTINNSELKASVTEVIVSAEVLRTKDVPINVAGVSGTPAMGYVYTGVSVEPEAITIAGLKQDTAAFTGITIPAEDLNIDGISESTTVEIDVAPYLPANIEIREESTLVSVHISIEEIKTKSVRIPSSAITLTGTVDGMIYDLAENCVVTLRGLQEDLDALDAEDILLSLDLAGMEPGEYTLNVKVELPVGYTLSEVCVIRVAIEEETEPETEEESIGTSPTESESGEGRALFLD